LGNDPEFSFENFSYERITDFSAEWIIVEKNFVRTEKGEICIRNNNRKKLRKVRKNEIYILSKKGGVSFDHYHIRKN
jgi:hypothetical protein